MERSRRIARRSNVVESTTAVDLVGRYSNPDELLRQFDRLRHSPRQKRSTAGRQPRQAQKRLAEHEIAELISCHTRGDTIDVLARRFGIHRTTVIAHIDRAGVERRTGIVTRRIDEAGRLYESGWSLARVAAEYRVNAETVRRGLRAAGVPIRPRPGI